MEESIGICWRAGKYICPVSSVSNFERLIIKVCETKVRKDIWAGAKLKGKVVLNKLTHKYRSKVMLYDAVKRRNPFILQPRAQSKYS
jgi:hypothetical protein